MRHRIRCAGPDRGTFALCRGLGMLLLLLLAGCGGSSSAPAEALGEPASEMERQVEGLALPENSARVEVVTDTAERSMTEYVVSDSSVETVRDFHLERLGENGWQEDSDRRADLDGGGVRLHFARGTWETPEGVESQRYRLTVEIVPADADVRVTWTLVDQQAMRG